MKRPLRHVGIVLVVAGGLPPLCGCMSPMDRLRAEVQRIHRDGASNDNTVRVLAIIATDNRPIRALATMNEPKGMYLATYRFVTAVVKANEVTLYHRGITRTYPIKERVYAPVWNSFLGGWESWYSYGDADTLTLCLTGKRYALREVLVVCDLELNPIESEESFLNREYPTLITKYSRFSQQEYEEWLSTAANRESAQKNQQ